MDLGIEGRKALVCASSKGLGKACAKALAREVDDLFRMEGLGETRALIVMHDGKLAAE